MRKPPALDLKSGYPFWAVRNGLMHDFPRLDRDLRCSVAVVGAGITGAIVADALARDGHEVVVLEQCEVAWGSTAASTALLQYEIDTHLVELARRVGEQDAARAYRACAEAIGTLGELAREVGDCGFENVRSLYFASTRHDVASLAEEFAARRRIGLEVAWLDRAALADDVGLDAPAAILSARAARMDPYRFASHLLDRLRRDGAAVHDRTPVVALEPGARGVVLRTDRGHVVRADHAVLAAGYATQQWLRRSVARNRSTYAYVTDPQAAGALGPLAELLVWETARPYLYLRTTVDGRLLVGGEDDAVDVPTLRDRRVGRKAKRLGRRVHALFPHLDVAPAFAWGGTFAETADGLPWFGPHPDHGPRVHFAMAYGGNGITYAVIGAEIVRARLARRPHPLAKLLGFGRGG
jgi:glycine/D-amino acid oxidase-like deaminating enzyme